MSIILIVACFAQLFSCVFQGNFQNAFMIGLAPSDYGLEITKFLPLLLPVCFILFFTSGSIENLKQGYGKMLIVRNYSKTVLILKRCLNNFIALICIVLFQILFCSTNQRTPHIIQKHQADNNHQCTDHRKATSLLQHTTTHISFSSLFYASQR